MELILSGMFVSMSCFYSVLVRIPIELATFVVATAQESEDLSPGFFLEATL